MKFTRQQMRTGHNRLKKLADLLRTVPDERFNYRHWVGKNWGGKADLSCGTTACALGWATTIPSLRKVGLRLERTTNSYGDVSSWPTVININNRDEIAPFAVGAEVFYISFEDSEKLFAPDATKDEWDATGSEVADKIENYIAQRENFLNSLK